MAEQPIYHFVKTRAGEYHTGIPARDLTEDDVKALTDEQRETLEASPIYRRIEQPSASDAPAEKPTRASGRGTQATTGAAQAADTASEGKDA